MTNRDIFCTDIQMEKLSNMFSVLLPIMIANLVAVRIALNKRVLLLVQRPASPILIHTSLMFY